MYYVLFTINSAIKNEKMKHILDTIPQKDFKINKHFLTSKIGVNIGLV